MKFDTTLQQGILERLKYGATTRIGAQLLHDIDLAIIPDMVRDQFMVNLETTLLAERIETKYEEHPKGWRDHFKVEHPRLVRWWSKWVWNLVQPEMEKYRFTDWATFPKNSYVVPNKFGPVVYLRQVEKIWDEF